MAGGKSRKPPANIAIPPNLPVGSIQSKHMINHISFWFACFYL